MILLLTCIYSVCDADEHLRGVDLFCKGCSPVQAPLFSHYVPTRGSP